MIGTSLKVPTGRDPTFLLLPFLCLCLTPVQPWDGVGGGLSDLPPPHPEEPGTGVRGSPGGHLYVCGEPKPLVMCAFIFSYYSLLFPPKYSARGQEGLHLI